MRIGPELGAGPAPGLPGAGVTVAVVCSLVLLEVVDLFPNTCADGRASEVARLEHDARPQEGGWSSRSAIRLSVE
jgi:hypothetical protein